MKVFLEKVKRDRSDIRLLMTMAAFAVAALLWAPARAMHIAEGFLPMRWAAIWYVVALPFVFYGFKRLNSVLKDHPKAKILLAMAGAFAFILSALKIPSLTGSCSHPTGIALGAILFGPGPMAIIGLIVLLFQALLLAHGGITTLGANLFSMGIVGAWVAYGTYRLMRKSGLSMPIAVFFAAFLGDLMTYVVTALQLAVAFPAAEGGMTASLVKFLGIFAVTQVPIAIAEGILSVIIFGFIAQYSSEQLIGLDKDMGYGDETQLKRLYESNKSGSLRGRTIALVIAAALVAIIPLYVVKDAEFGGADGAAMDIVAEIDPSFEPIFEPLLEPASGEIESMLFALQAAFGAGIIGYGLGRITKGKNKEKEV